MDAEQGQGDHQIDCREGGVDRRDAHLSKHHATKRVGKSLYAFGQGDHQRRWSPCIERMCRFLYRDYRADDHAKHNVGKSNRGIHAHLLQLGGVIAKQLRSALLQLVEADRQRVDQPVWCAGANLMENAFDPLAKLCKISGIAAKKCDSANDGEDEATNHQRRE